MCRPIPRMAKTQRKVYEKVLQLPVPMRDSKMLLRLLRLQLQADPPPGDIVKITLAADPARPRSAQGGLFVPGFAEPGKAGAYRRAAGKTGWQREYRLA